MAVGDVFEEPFLALRQARAGDIPEMLDLQEANLPDRGGTLSARLSGEWFLTAMQAMPVIVAHKTRLLGYLVSSPLEAYARVPVVEAMLEAYRGAPDAYVYGPICVAEEARGQGIARKMFAALKARLPGREGILFIRGENQASLRAHAKMGISQRNEFEHVGTRFVVLSYVG
jgi:GNAT superfamily N-acetyltransferase